MFIFAGKLDDMADNDFNFKGWSDENVENPKESGMYLCLEKFYNYDDYHYSVLYYDNKTKCWVTMDCCEHILWTNLPPSPFF